jgi:hypothetical protein
LQDFGKKAMQPLNMDLDQIAYQLENSTTLKLLKSEYASLAVGFFFYAFKKNYKVQIPEVELRAMLEIYLQQDPEKTNSVQLADRLLTMWCDDKHRFLRRFYDHESDTPIVELSYDTERALEWVESLEKREFVGTHSRFFMIFENLRTIVEQTHPDPQKRLKFLEQQKKEVSQEIKEIQQTGTYKRMDATQVRERFLNLIDDSRRLISDFGLVEEIFKELTQKIKEKKLIEFVTKGQILGEILDAYDYLEDSDQGKSFNAFWDFLMSSDMQRDLNEMIQQVLSAEEIQSYIKEMGNPYYSTQLKKLKANLLQVGKKVLQSKLRLSEELRKLLHQKSLQENKQVTNEINEIKKCFIENKELFLNLADKEFLHIEFLPEIFLPMERPIWNLSSDLFFEQSSKLEYGENDQDLKETQLEDLRRSFYLNPEELKKKILALIENREELTLKEIVTKYPIEKGISEVIGYLDIAELNQANSIDTLKTDRFVFKTPGGEGKMAVPQVVFLKLGV